MDICDLNKVLFKELFQVWYATKSNITFRQRDTVSRPQKACTPPTEKETQPRIEKQVFSHCIPQSNDHFD